MSTWVGDLARALVVAGARRPAAPPFLVPPSSSPAVIRPAATDALEEAASTTMRHTAGGVGLSVRALSNNSLCVGGAFAVEGPASESPSAAVISVLSKLLLSKPSLVSIPVEVVTQRILHLAKRSGWPVHSQAIVVRPPPDDAGDCSSSNMFCGGTGENGRSILEACVSGPDMIAVTSCFIDRRAAEVGPLLQLAGGDKE